MPEPTAPRRADAERNRDKILAAARTAFAEPGPPPSMAEVSRRAGVGMATLYRNFPGRRDLLEALYLDEIDGIVDAAGTVEGDTAGQRFTTWLLRFARFVHDKHEIGADLLAQPDDALPFMNAGRDRVVAAGAHLLEAAQKARDVRADLTLQQTLDMVIAVASINGDADYVEPILRSALDGLRPR